MLKSALSIILVSGVGILAYPQDDFTPLEWGKASINDRSMMVYEMDTSAHAVVLGDEGYMDVVTGDHGKYNWVLRRHRRVKILHEAAIREYGNVSIYYYHKDRRDQLRNVKAQTITPDGTVTEVAAKEIYREKVNEYWTKATFAFANVVVGSILEYRYAHFSERILTPKEWSFRENIPVRSSYFNFVCSVPVTYTYLLRGAEFMTEEALGDGRGVLRTGDMEIYVDGTRFWMKNGAAVVPEPFMTAVEDYYIKVRFQASEVISATGYSNSVYGSWEETCRDLLNLNDLGLAFTKKRGYRKLLEAARGVITPGDDELQTVYEVSRFITEQIKWSGRQGIRTDISLDEAFERHEADLPEVQYAGLALLREFGIEAHPVILSTRDNGAMIQAFPFLDQFNYVILLVEVNGQYQLVDMSDPLLKPGNVRVRALNKHGFLLNAEQPGWINLQLPVLQDILAWNGEITADGTLIGELKCTMSSYSARSERAAMQERSLEEIWTKRLPDGNSLQEMAASNEADIRQPLTLTGKFEVPNAGFANDDFLYVSPLVYASFSTNPFSREERDYPIDFPYPFEEKSVYSYQLPEGYEVESLPENATLSLPDGDAVFQYMIRERNGKISIIIVNRVKKTLYPPSEYSALRSIFEQAAAKMQEQIVLRKVND